MVEGALLEMLITAKLGGCGHVLLTFCHCDLTHLTKPLFLAPISYLLSCVTYLLQE